MSPEIALYTIFRRGVNFVTAGLRIDHTATPYDYIVSKAVMAIRIGVSIGKRVLCFAAMSNRLVCIPKYGTPFVFGLRYMKMSLTKTGQK